MEVAILLAIEQVEHGPRHARKTAEVADRGGIDVHAAKAAVVCNHVADACGSGIEAFGPAAKTGKEMEVSDFSVLDDGAYLHGGLSSEVCFDPIPRRRAGLAGARAREARAEPLPLRRPGWRVTAFISPASLNRDL